MATNKNSAPANAVPTFIESAPGRAVTPTAANAVPTSIDAVLQWAQNSGRANTSTKATSESPGRAKARAASNLVAPSRAEERPTTKMTSPDRALPSMDEPEPMDGSAGAPGDGSDPPPTHPPAGMAMSEEGPILESGGLYLLAAQLDNIESLRIAAENRHRQATRSVEDVDGHLRGLGLPADDPAVIMSASMKEALKATEHKVELALARTMRKHPLGAWQKATLGVGEKQLARLLASIGDPYWNGTKGEPRRVSDLWSYCGVGDASKQIRKRGERANWSATAKFRSWLIAQKCMMILSSPYRPLYEQARAHYAEAVHEQPCVRCGPSGKPAPAGSPLSLAHQHARGIRAVQKELLKDLWRESRRLHSPGIDQNASDNPIDDPSMPA
jgi:hypothetical protein